MLEYIKLIILGAVEGITEFMPISSTAHLLLLQRCLSFDGIDATVLKTFPQLGCALALLFYYRQKIFYLLTNWSKTRDAERSVANLMFATLPLLLAPIITHLFITDTTYLMSINLVAVGILMLIVETFRRVVRFTTIAEIPTNIALIIGFAQLLAVFAGVSRSGATILAALILQIDRKTAVEFSFLLAIPAIMAAVGWEILSNYQIIFVSAQLTAIFLTAGVAFLISLMVIQPLINLLSSRKLTFFAFYRIILGGILWLCL